MSTKPEWWKSEDEKEPGNPLSRIVEWRSIEQENQLWPSPAYARHLLRELLAVIDRQSEEHEGYNNALRSHMELHELGKKRITELEAQLAAAEEERASLLKSARTLWLFYWKLFCHSQRDDLILNEWMPEAMRLATDAGFRDLRRSVHLAAQAAEKKPELIDCGCGMGADCMRATTRKP